MAAVKGTDCSRRGPGRGSPSYCQVLWGRGLSLQQTVLSHQKKLGSGGVPGPGLFCFVSFCLCKQRPLQSSLIKACSPSFSFTSLTSPGKFSPSKLTLSHGLPFSNLFWHASDIRITSEKEKQSFSNSLTCNWIHISLQWLHVP